MLSCEDTKIYKIFKTWDEVTNTNAIFQTKSHKFKSYQNISLKHCALLHAKAREPNHTHAQTHQHAQTPTRTHPPAHAKPTPTSTRAPPHSPPFSVTQLSYT